MHSTNLDFEVITNKAKEFAIKAGKYLLKVQTKTSVVEYKDRLDVCTTADLESEKIIIDGIQSVFPNHRIKSEESGDNNKSSDYLWLIDPLDGTKEFIRNIPQFNVSIAVEYKGKLVTGVVYRPADQSLYSATIGLGSYLNDNRIQVSNTTQLSNAFVYCYLPSYYRNPEVYDQSWGNLQKIGKATYRIRSYADENTMLCWLAQGGHEAYLNLSNPPKWHDIAPGILIAKEAGGYISDNLIKQIKNGNSNSLIIANQATMYQEILSLISKE